MEFLSKEQIKKIEELTNNEYLFAEPDNDLEDIMEWYGSTSENGDYHFLEGVNMTWFTISFFNDRQTIIWHGENYNGEIGVPLKWLKPLAEILEESIDEKN